MIAATFRDSAYCGTDQELLHFHADYEMLYVVKGWADVHVAQRVYRCEAPAAVFFGNLENHRILASSDDYERYVLTISQDDLRETPPLLLSLFRSRPESFSHVLSMKNCSFAAETMFAALAEETKRSDEHAALCRESLVQLLLANLCRFAPQAFPAGVQEHPQAIVEAQRYLDGHFCEPLVMDDVARRFYMSPSYFRHQFQELIGLAPKQYVMLNRLAFARELLCSTRMNVTEVAEKCGFSDVSNFIRRFKAHYGVTPRAMSRADE